MKCFALDITASRAAILCDINSNSAEDRYNYFRKAIYEHCETYEKELRSGTIEMDESYFGARRVK